jgi:hypothetical protein
MLTQVDPGLGEAVNELQAVWRQSQLSPDVVRNMKTFGPLFGRETVHVSFTRQQLF